MAAVGNPAVVPPLPAGVRSSPSRSRGADQDEPRRSVAAGEIAIPGTRDRAGWWPIRLVESRIEPLRRHRRPQVSTMSKAAALIAWLVSRVNQIDKPVDGRRYRGGFGTREL